MVTALFYVNEVRGNARHRAKTRKNRDPPSVQSFVAATAFVPLLRRLPSVRCQATCWVAEPSTCPVLTPMRKCGEKEMRQTNQSAVSSTATDETGESVSADDPSSDVPTSHTNHQSAADNDGPSGAVVASCLREDAKQRDEHRKEEEEMLPSPAVNVTTSSIPLVETSSHEQQRKTLRSADANTPVCERLYKDAVHTKEEHEQLKEMPSNKREPHIHPFATDLRPKAQYLRRMDTSLTVDGGSIEHGKLRSIMHLLLLIVF